MFRLELILCLELRLLCDSGLLTVNPKERLTMQDLIANEWINGRNLETTPLATPDVLSLTPGSINAVQSQITATLSAFHQVHRAGFRLQSIDNAPLVVRRRKRMREEGGSSGSTDSSRASTPVPPATNVLSPLAASTTTSPTLRVVALPDTPDAASFQPSGSAVATQPVICDTLPLPQLATPQLDLLRCDDSAASRGFGLRRDSPSSCSTELRRRSSAAASSVTSDSLAFPQLATSQSVYNDLCSLQRDDSAASCGFGLRRDSPLLCSAELRPSSAAASSLSRRSTPNHSPAHSSPSSRGSTPQRSPISHAESITSLGFSPAANSSENSHQSSTPTAVSDIPSSVSHSDGSFTAGLCCDNVGRKRKLSDSSEHHSCIRNDDGDDNDDDCVIIGVSEGIASSSSDIRKKIRTQL